MSSQKFTRQIPNARAEVRPPKTFEVEGEDAVAVATAIGSETRWKIIRTLAEDTQTIQELTEKVDLSKGTISVHVQQLEEAGVVGSRFNVSDNGGVEKEIALTVDEVTLSLSNR